mgnify:CR=1 FL=1
MLAPERHPKVPQQSTSFFVGARGGHDGNVKALDLIDLVVVDLREDNLLANADGEVSTAIE